MLAAAYWVGALAASTHAAEARPSTDVLYEALHGEPEAVDLGLLLASPGRFVGRAVTTQGRLERVQAGKEAFRLSAGESRALLRLEPQAAAMVVTRASDWVGRSVDVDGLFHRDVHDPGESSYALRVWRVRAPGGPQALAESPARDALEITLEELVYAAGRHDGKLVLVRGTYRGANVHRDLPEATRRNLRDWVIKDGYFAAWVTGRAAHEWSLPGTSPVDTDTSLEIVGVPTTSHGTVRLSARRVEVSLAPLHHVVGRAMPTGGAGGSAGSPHVSFTYPVAGDALDRRGHMAIQFDRPMDPSRFEAAVRVRYEREGTLTGVPRVALMYSDRYRVLVLTPESPPPADTDVVVELGEGVVDVDGRALVPHVVEQRSRSQAAEETGREPTARSTGRAQEGGAPRPPTFGTGVGVVRLDVSVLSPEDHLVTDLDERDFEIYEDGQRQAPTSFVRRDLPMSLVLLLDASASIGDRVSLARAAAIGFLDALRCEDDASVIAFNDSVSVLQTSTPNRDALRHAIGGISAESTTALYNALYSTLKELGRRPRDAELRRRAVLLLSDGADTASLVWEEQVVELARRSEVPIHVIDLRPRDGADRSARLLRLLSRESGGGLHRPASIHDLDAVYSRIGEELKRQFTVGYVSSDPSQDGRWRTVEVRIRGRRELQVRHRTGYYALP